MLALAFPGWEVGETRGTVTTLSGLMEHPGITATGPVEHHMLWALELRTVLISGLQDLMKN